MREGAFIAITDKILMRVQKMIELHADVSVEFLEFGAKHCLALIWVLLLLTAEPIHQRV